MKALTCWRVSRATRRRRGSLHVAPCSIPTWWLSSDWSPRAFLLSFPCPACVLSLHPQLCRDLGWTFQVQGQVPTDENNPHRFRELQIHSPPLWCEWAPCPEFTKCTLPAVTTKIRRPARAAHECRLRQCVVESSFGRVQTAANDRGVGKWSQRAPGLTCGFLSSLDVWREEKQERRAS